MASSLHTHTPLWRKTLSLTALVVFWLLATGCGGTSSGTSKTAPVIRVWRVNQDIDSLRSSLLGFQKDQSVSILYSNKSLDNYELTALKSLAAQTGPDLWSIPSEWLGDNYQALTPLSNLFYSPDGKKAVNAVDQVRNIYPSGIADQLVINNTVYGLPTNVDTLQMYVNTSLLSTAKTEYLKAHPELKETEVAALAILLKDGPKTWNQLNEQAPYVNKISNGTFTRSLVALGTADNVPNSDAILQVMMMQNGVDIVSTDHSSVLFNTYKSTPSGAQIRPGENALDYYTSFANPAKPNYSWNSAMPPAIDAFATSKVAIVIAYSDFGQQLRTKYPKFKDYTTEPIPQISAAQDPVDLIKFMVEAVPKTSVFNTTSMKLLQIYKDETLVKSLASESKTRSSFRTTLEKASDSDYYAKQILTGKAIFKVNHTQFDAAFRQMIVDVSENKISTTVAIDTAAQTINKLLAPAEVDPRDNISPNAK
jgi:ABC-type glycerol-3-phosphate transport system substrate-binding protein